MDLTVCCSRKAVELNHSLAHWYCSRQNYQSFSNDLIIPVNPVYRAWVGVMSFSKVGVIFNHVDGSFNLFKYYHRGCLNNPIFKNLGLCAACWVHFMCHHEFWPTSVSLPFFSLNSSLGLAGGNYYQKLTIPFFLQNFALPPSIAYNLFYSYLFSLLSSGWFVIALVALYFSPGN